MSSNRTIRSLRNARSFQSKAQVENSGLQLLAETRPAKSVRGLHPGDVVYWLACLGGACLLLLCATT